MFWKQLIFWKYFLRWRYLVNKKKKRFGNYWRNNYWVSYFFVRYLLWLWLQVPKTTKVLVTLLALIRLRPACRFHSLKLISYVIYFKIIKLRNLKYHWDNEKKYWKGEISSTTIVYFSKPCMTHEIQSVRVNNLCQLILW